MQHPRTLARRAARRAVRVGALAVASGTAVVAAATGAGAATAPDSYAGTTASVALNLSLLKGAPGLSSAPVDTADGLVSVQLLPAAASLVHSASTTSAASSVALYGGTLATLPGAPAAPVASSSLAKPGPNHASGALGLPDPLSLDPAASASVPDLTASSTATPLTTSSSATGVGVDAAKLADLIPAADLAQLQTGCDTLASQLDTLIALLQTLDAANPLPAGSTMVDPFGALEATLTTAETQSKAACTDILTGAVVSVKGLVSSSSIKTVGSQEVATAHVELGSISLLGGFASVDGFNNTVTAKAGGKPGTASFTPDITDGGLGALHIAGQTAGIDAGGLEAEFGAVAKYLPLSASQLDAVFSGLQTGLSALNSGLMGIVTISADTPTNVKVAADGTSATGELAGLSLAVNLPTALPSSLTGGSAALTDLLSTLIKAGGPDTSTLTTLLGGLGGTPLSSKARASAAASSDSVQVVSLQVGSVGAAAEAQDLPVTVKGETFTKTPTTGVAPATKLAFTGADLPVTGGVALLLVLGGAYALRRRRAGHDEL